MNLNDRFSYDLCTTCGVSVEKEEDQERHNDWHNDQERTWSKVQFKLEVLDIEGSR